MEIAVDARIAGHSGIGRYLENLLPAIIRQNQDVFFHLLGNSDKLASVLELGQDNVRVLDCRSELYALRAQWAVPGSVPETAQLLWIPHYVVPLMWRGPLAVTVHDLCHLACWRLFGGWGARAYARGMLEAVRRRADTVLVDSAFTRAEFLRRIGQPVGTLQVVPLGVDPWWCPADTGGKVARQEARRGVSTGAGSRGPAHHPQEALAPVAGDDEVPSESFFLFVGNIKPHKNLGLAISALEQIAHRVEHALVIVGRREGMRTVDRQALEEAKRLGSRARFLDNVSDRLLRELYRRAEALLVPSFYEGFGLPALEAMACGCPVIAARAGALPEVCGHFARYCDPHDSADLARHMLRITKDPDLRRDLSRAGLQRATEFRWEAAAARTGRLLRAAAHRTGE